MNLGGPAGLTVWPAYDPGKDTTSIWAVPPGQVDGIRASNCNFWDSLQGLAMQLTRPWGGARGHSHLLISGVS